MNFLGPETVTGKFKRMKTIIRVLGTRPDGNPAFVRGYPGLRHNWSHHTFTSYEGEAGTLAAVPVWFPLRLPRPRSIRVPYLRPRAMLMFNSPTRANR